jgi:hypothetical protein
MFNRSVVCIEAAMAPPFGGAEMRVAWSIAIAEQRFCAMCIAACSLSVAPAEAGREAVRSIAVVAVRTQAVAQ